MENAEMNYSRLLQAILDIAEEMLVAGAEVSRVEDSVERMCGAYGCDRINVFVITSNIQGTMEKSSRRFAGLSEMMSILTGWII